MIARLLPALAVVACLTSGGVQPRRAAAADPPGRPANRLAREASPYLRQHAGNPVDWYPWGPEAFAKAAADGKLVFLSVGYSSCHWCHVMERESFADPGVAAVLNRHFVCVKVDREERPDVDEVYLAAMQAVGQGGGWPLSVFLTPAGKPIFGGTYWPPEDRRVDGEPVPGFRSVLGRVVDLHRDKKADLFAQADKVAALTADALDRAAKALPTVALDRAMVAAAAGAFDFDPEHGGLGSRARGYRGPKFPRPAALGFLLRQAARPGGDALRGRLAQTLDKMTAGGILDHLGGGFHRYSTDRTWTVPHFEKMLYDQAQLAELLADAYRADPKPAYRRAVADTLEFVRRELTSPDGAFYSAVDADSDGHEGRFTVWTEAEIDAVLGPGADARLFKQVYGVREPNFEGKFHILLLPRPLAEAAREAGLTEDGLVDKLAPLKAKLFAAREKRPRPFLDTKVLTGWNGQMVAGYARAGEALREPGYTAAAEQAADFLLRNLRRPDGRLLRMYAAAPGAPPTARGPAVLEDYALLGHGLLTLHDATGRARWLDEAKAVADAMLRWHGDDRGGFFTTAHDADKLFARGKDSYDGAQPSGNGAAVRNLVRLASKTGDDRYRAAAEKALRLVAPTLRAEPQAAPVTADALDRYLDLPRSVSGRPD